MPSDMPSETPSSDDRDARIRHALAGPLSDFRSALATTVEEVRGLLDSRPSDDGRPAEGNGKDLGLFAAGLIDKGRFTAMVSRKLTLDGAAFGRIEQAFEALHGLAGRKDEAFVVHVPPGGDLRDTVAAAFRDVGRAFGAARVVELARQGGYDESKHAGMLSAFPFQSWNRAERRLAPPIVVHVAGGDLFAEGLAEFLDGRTRIVLVVDGPASAAPLVRLVAPGTFVMQTSDAAALARMGKWDGPGIAALMPEGAAQFVHDPAAGETLAQRLEVGSIPEGKRLGRLGRRSVQQQLQELEQVRMLAAQAKGAAVAAAVDDGGAPVDPVDKLAAWLLMQANLEDLG